MTQTLILIGVGLGLLAVVGVVLRCLVQRWPSPDLAQAVTLLLSGVGIVTGIDLGYTTLTAAPTALGVLNGHQVSIIVGALAIVWVSGAHIIKTFLSPRGSVDNQ